jgi:hypothetical protein
MTHRRRPVMMATRSANAATPPHKALDTESRAGTCASACVESDARSGGSNDEDEEGQYRRAVDFLRDFHRRAQTLDVIYEEEGRDPSTASRPSRSGTALSAAGASHPTMLKVRTTGSLLDLLPTDNESLGGRGPTRAKQQQQPEQQQLRESSDLLPPSKTGPRELSNGNGSDTMEWGHYDEDNDDLSSDVITDESETHRTMQGMAARRILLSTCHPRFHAHRPHRRQSRRHFPTCAGKPQNSHLEKDRPLI